MSKIIPILLFSIALSACAGVPANTPTPQLLATPTSRAGSICGSPANWSIQYNRSGGFAGFDESLTLDSAGNLTVQSERPPTDERRTISEDQVKAITDLLVQACPFETGSGEGTCADCFSYTLTVQMDGRTYAVKASDVTLTDNLHPLVDTLNQLLQPPNQ